MIVAVLNCVLHLKNQRFLNCVRNKFILVCFVINFVCLKVCNCNASEQNQTALPTTRNHYSNDQLSTYFRHDPYGPRTYAFGFELNDNKTGNRQFRDERRFANGTIEGSYGYVRPDGRLSVTHFFADPKRGYLSQTRTLEQGDTDETNWRMYFWTDRENIDENKATHTRKRLNETESNAVNVDHIDLEKDLLEPTLTNILELGNLPLIDSQEKSKATEELKTFQNVIPNHFPIVPFELPQKMLENLKSNESEIVNEMKSDEANANFDHSTSATTTKSSIQQYTTTPAGMIKHKVVGQSDWITSFVNQTRREFLDN